MNIRFAKVFVLCSLFATTLVAQEKRYFTRFFQKESKEATNDVRKYLLEENKAIVEDYTETKLVQRSEIYGLNDLDQIDAFLWYSRQQGADLYYNDYFMTVRGVIDSYSSGCKQIQLVVRDRAFRFGQVWNGEGAEMLVNGTGENLINTEEENVYEKFVDSIRVIRYGIRVIEKDTIYQMYDKMASPKNGMQDFYQRLVNTVKYPGFARLAGKEGRVYIQFLVDEKGRLTDFKPLTSEGYKFESRIIKKLEEFPAWTPAIYHGRNVKTKFVLPVVFKLTG